MPACLVRFVHLVAIVRVRVVDAGHEKAQEAQRTEAAESLTGDREF
jgi:hypothetical protein